MQYRLIDVCADMLESSMNQLLGDYSSLEGEFCTR